MIPGDGCHGTDQIKIRATPGQGPGVTGGEVKPPGMRLVRKGGFGVYEEIIVDEPPPFPEFLTLRGLLKSLTSRLTANHTPT